MVKLEPSRNNKEVQALKAELEKEKVTNEKL